MRNLLKRIALAIAYGASPRTIFGHGPLPRMLRRSLLSNSSAYSVPIANVDFSEPTPEEEPAYKQARVNEEIDLYLARLRVGV